MTAPLPHARSLGAMPDVSDWSFSRTTPAPPAPPARPNGTAPPAPAIAGSATAPASPGAPAPEAATGARNKRTVIRIALVAGGVVVVAGLLVAIYFVLNAGSGTNGDLSGYSGVPADYVPVQVDGRDVRTKSAALEEITKRFTSARGLDGAAFEVAAGMIPQGPREPPASVVIVLAGIGADGLAGSFAGDGAVREDTTVDADGVEVRLVRVDDDVFGEVWTAIASPREDVAVVAMSFSGGRQAAEDMARAALERGKQ